MTKIKNPRTEQYARFWDDGNWNMIEWFKKGEWKKILRKKSIKSQLKDLDNE